MASMSMNILHNLMVRFSLSEFDIGRIEVGTETLFDHSKSIKTSLMQLLPNNCNVEGVTNLNACYGGTAALQNCVN